jgi:glycosyltransferase involved in cell wall biosynthesis
VTPGPYYADMLAQEPVRVVICAPGISDALRHAPRARSGPCQLVSLGAVTRLKGFRDVLEALQPRAADPSFRFTVFGSELVDPDYARSVRELAQDFPGVTLAGQVSPAEVHARLAQAHVLVMPSYSENHPLALLEATAASVPAVAYAAGATRALVGHGTTGRVVEIGDVTALARELDAMIDDEPQRRRLAEGCWERQREIPGWPEAARRAREALDGP